jgi:hypothetical protein
MTKRYIPSTTITAEPAGICLGQHMTQTLVKGGTPAALADGRPTAVERDELVKSIDQRGSVAAISRCDIVETFNNNNRAPQVEHRRGANAIVKTLCLSASLLLCCVAVYAVERVTAAERRIRSRTIQRLGDRKRWRQNVGGRRSQRRASWNPIVMQNLGCLVGPLSGSTRLCRTPSDGRLPLGREE